AIHLKAERLDKFRFFRPLNFDRALNPPLENSKTEAKIDGLAKTPDFGNRWKNPLIISRGYFSGFHFPDFLQSRQN
ncbi:MAG: hypothetical protein LBE01_02875, partial [Deltaproteobacteria bacterium]|nr:hypothetical protein [Deltaproteobacteria bacterium]